MPLQINSIEAPMGGLVGAPSRQLVHVGFVSDPLGSRIPYGNIFWQTGDAVPPAPDQANTPVAFQLANGNRGIPVTVRGSHDFAAIPAWAGVRFRLTGSCGATTIESQYTTRNAGGAGAFTATNFTFVTSNYINYPFRAAGDWVWTISAENNNPALGAVALSNTRIEMYVFVGDSDPVFGNLLRAELLRLAVPPYALGAALNQNVQDTQRTYMAFIANNIWNFATTSNVIYDCEHGRASFVQSYWGGCFRLAEFLRPDYIVLVPSQFYFRYRRHCNCYDLAGIVDLAFKALGNATNNTLILRPLWRYLQPFGYVKQGPLFGWPQYPNLNSPFWWPFGQQNFPNPLDPRRTMFGNHAFTEVDFPLPTPSERIVDVCKAILPAAGPPIVISDGSQDRTAYFNAAIDVGYQAIVQINLYMGFPGVSLII